MMKTGILFIHGFTGNTVEVQPLADFIAEKNEKIICSIPTLSGHGVELKLHGVRATHWFRDVENAYRTLASKVDHVVVVGFSMGGVLALYLALRYPVERLVLLSAAVKYIDPKQLYLVAKELLMNRKNLTEEQNRWLQHCFYQAKNMNPMAIKSFTEVVHQVTPYLAEIKQPVMIVQGEKDGLVPRETADYLFEHLGSTEKIKYLSENGHHHICFSDDRNKWFEQVYDFIFKENKNQNIMPDCN